MHALVEVPLYTREPIDNFNHEYDVSKEHL